MSRRNCVVWLGCLTATLVMAGCENGIILHTKVTVPAALTQSLTESRPGLVVIGAFTLGVASTRLAIICAPVGEDLVIPWTYDNFGCAEQSVLTARMFVVDAAELSAPCGIATTPGEAPQSASLVAQASATVLKDSGSVLGCVSGEDSADLVLAAVEQ